MYITQLKLHTAICTSYEKFFFLRSLIYANLVLIVLERDTLLTGMFHCIYDLIYFPYFYSFYKCTI